jgi:ketosteroid isomerase-like protein
MALLEQSLARMNAGDLEGVLEGVHPDVVWYAPPEATASAYRGRDGIREFVAEWLEAWGKFEQEVREVRTEGDLAVARIGLRTRGEASGVEVEQEGGYVMQLRDQKLVEMRIFMTFDEALAAFEAKKS